MIEASRKAAAESGLQSISTFEGISLPKVNKPTRTID